MRLVSRTWLASRNSASGQVGRRRDLEVVFTAFDQQRMQAEALHRLRVVGDRHAGVAAPLAARAATGRDGTPAASARATCRRAVRSLSMPPSSIHALEGIADRRGQDRADRHARWRHRSIAKIVMPQVRARGIVDQHHVVARDTGRATHAGRPARNRRAHRRRCRSRTGLPCKRVQPGQCGSSAASATTTPSTASVRQQGTQRVFDQRLACRMQVLLGDIGAEAATTAGGGHQRPGHCAGSGDRGLGDRFRAAHGTLSTTR